ncbi:MULTISPECIES: hypothetical protein [unclassified Actinomadura]|uniref:hypothetical protein n=1 Tax=unclassified Actinomadura TaxID=2626254 RepID=UPI0011ED3AB2|nr:hypothetical protein [Actinomadura sp. K4S16]
MRWAYDGLPAGAETDLEWQVHLLTVRADGEITAYPLPWAAGIDRERGHDPVPGMLDVVRRHAEDRQVELNPYFTAHRQVDATDAEWEAVLDAAARLRARLAAGPGETAPGAADHGRD